MIMKIQTLNRLNEKQLKKVSALLYACRDYEPLTLTPPLENHCFSPDIPIFYLLYENNELISFLSLFLPNRYEGEVMAFTHPMARQRGYFTRLWNEVLEQLDDYMEEMDLLFVTDGQSPDALAALEAMEGEYQYSEYIMEKGMDSSSPASAGDTELTLELVQPSDANLLLCTDIHEEIFCDGQSASEAFIREIFDTPASRTWLACEADSRRPVGIFHLTEWEEGTYLSGFGVLPDAQGRGLGTRLLQAIPACLNPGHTRLTLQVSSLNEEACRLYQNQGFSISLRRDYYY